MKIKTKEKTNPILLNALSYGVIFKYCHKYYIKADTSLYLQCNNGNIYALELHTGLLAIFTSNPEVELINMTGVEE